MDGFDFALRLLPGEIRENAARLEPQARREALEFRLRRGRLPAVLLPTGERALPCSRPATAAELLRVLELCTNASPYAAADTLRQGFVTAAGGVRVGFCGQAVTESGEIRSIKWLSSAAVRIPREVRGCAAGLAEGKFVSTLILSPPGGGKTTLLRDMVRQLSDGGRRVALCDERSEVAAFADGVPGFDVGARTDVLTGAPKSEAALMLLRAMTPEIIAMDEITAAADIAACETVSNCGVGLLATAHAADTPDLAARPLYRALLELGIFRRAVVIGQADGLRRYREETLC